MLGSLAPHPPRLSATPNWHDASYVQLLANVDPQLRAEPRWLLWKLIYRATPAKPLKIPYYSDGSPRRKTDDARDRSNLSTFDNAVARYQAGGFQGLGFALGPDGTGKYWQGIDLDDIASNGLQQLVNALPGYRELSPSGKGVHAIGRGDPFPTLGSNGSGIEAYFQKRYLTVTGEPLGGELGCIAKFARGPLGALHHVKRPLRSRSDNISSPAPCGNDIEASIQKALAFVPADCSYSDWIRIGCALKSINARQLWLDWSYSSSKAVRGEAEAKWQQLSADRTSYPAIFAEAQRRGWHNPGSHYAANVPFNASAMALADKIRAGFAASLPS